MTSLKRTFLICTLSALTLGATAVFAQDVAAPKDSAAVSQAKPPEEGLLDLRNLVLPQPTNRSCTASTSCATLGGTPITCSGNTSCNWNTSWVLCDGNVTYCTCNPANISNCRDPQGFCDCWNASPTNGWGVCRQQYCWGA